MVCEGNGGKRLPPFNPTLGFGLIGVLTADWPNICHVLDGKRGKF